MAFKFASSFVRSLFNAGSAPIPSISFAGDENTGLYSPGADQVGIATAGTARVVVGATGLAGFGTATPAEMIHVYDGTAARIRIESEGTSAVAQYRAGANASSPSVSLYKRRGTIASPTVVSSGDGAGQILFNAYDGATDINAARIAAEVDGTPGTNDMPGRLLFSTTPDGSTTLTERMRIDNAGLITGTGTSLGAWTSYTPTLGGTGWALGDGTVDFYYCQVGKLVFMRGTLTFGASSTFGSAALTLTLPVTGRSGQMVNHAGITAMARDVSATARYILTPIFGSTTTMSLQYISSSVGLTGAVISTTPFTWASSDVIQVAAVYEAA